MGTCASKFLFFHDDRIRDRRSPIPLCPGRWRICHKSLGIEFGKTFGVACAPGALLGSPFDVCCCVWRSPLWQSAGSRSGLGRAFALAPADDPLCSVVGVVGWSDIGADDARARDLPTADRCCHWRSSRHVFARRHGRSQATLDAIQRCGAPGARQTSLWSGYVSRAGDAATSCGGMKRYVSTMLTLTAVFVVAQGAWALAMRGKTAIMAPGRGSADAAGIRCRSSAATVAFLVRDLVRSAPVARTPGSRRARMARCAHPEAGRRNPWIDSGSRRTGRTASAIHCWFPMARCGDLRRRRAGASRAELRVVDSRQARRVSREFRADTFFR